MSKQDMARLLIQQGCPKAFNTLRKYSREDLEAMLAQPTDTQLDQPTPHVPSDRELYAAAMKPVTEPEKPTPMPTWGASLTLVALSFLELISWK